MRHCPDKWRLPQRAPDLPGQGLSDRRRSPAVLADPPGRVSPLLYAIGRSSPLRHWGVVQYRDALGGAAERGVCGSPQTPCQPVLKPAATAPLWYIFYISCSLHLRYFFRDSGCFVFCIGLSMVVCATDQNYGPVYQTTYQSKLVSLLKNTITK